MVCTLIDHGNDISRMGMIIAMIKTQMNSNVQIAIANSNVHSNVQNSNETTSGSFEHFDVIAMVGKSTDHWKVVVDFFFTITLTVLKL